MQCCVYKGLAKSGIRGCAAEGSRIIHRRPLVGRQINRVWAASASIVASAQLMAAENWWQPSIADQFTAAPVDTDGHPIVVDFRVVLFNVSNVDTKDLTAQVHLGVVFYWTDSRLVGWKHPILPPTLWGPEMQMRGTVGPETKPVDEQFVLADASEGRLKRIVHYRGSIELNMELKAFPFDVQQLRIQLETISHWRQLDGTRRGSLPRGYSYIVQPVSRAEEGQLLWLHWDGTIFEWLFHSYSMQLSRSINPAGFTATRFELTLHVYRKFEHYLYKVVICRHGTMPPWAARRAAIAVPLNRGYIRSALCPLTHCPFHPLALCPLHPDGTLPRRRCCCLSG